MILRATLRAPKLNLEAYRRDLADRAKQTITEAAFVWVDTAIAIIPVWSGASRATFAQLARDINFQLQISPVSGAPNRVGLGESASGGGVDSDEEIGRFSFTYETDLTHLVINEQFDARQWGFRLRQPGPYNFQRAATEVARGVFETFIPPDVRDSISVVDIN